MSAAVITIFNLNISDAMMPVYLYMPTCARETERERERETDRQTDRQRERERDRESERPEDRGRERELD